MFGRTPVAVFSRTRKARSTAPSPVRPRSCMETLEDRRLMAVSPLALGLNANSVTSTNYKSLVTLLRDSGTTTVRLWYGFSDYDSRTANRVVTWAEKFKYDGFDVTMTVSPDGGLVGTPAQTTGLFNFLVGIPGLTNAVDRWEIGNEEDSSNYWKGSLKQYVGDFLAPASAVLHGVGEKVVSGGVSWNPADVQKLVDQGMLRYVDYVGYHPYRSTYADLVTKVAEVKAIADGKPLVATEWNVRGHEDDSSPVAWAADVKKFWPVIRDNFYAAYYYAATKVATPAGPAGVMKADGSPNEPFYSTYLTLQDSMPAASTTGGTTSGGTTSGGSTSGGSTSGGSTSGGSTSSGSTSGGSPSGGSTSGSAGSGSTSSGGSTSTGSTPTGSTTSGSATHSGSASSGGTQGSGSSGSGTVIVQHLPPPSKPKPVQPTISSFALVNADTDRVVKGQTGLSGMVTIDMSAVGTSDLTFLAAVNKKVKSVVWSVNGAVSVDSSGVFSLFGETRRRGMVGQSFAAGLYVITAQAFGGLNATGTAARRQTFTVNLINGAAAADTSGAAARIAYLKRKAARATALALSANRVSMLSGVSLNTTTTKKKKKT